MAKKGAGGRGPATNRRRKRRPTGNGDAREGRDPKAGSPLEEGGQSIDKSDVASRLRGLEAKKEEALARLQRIRERNSAPGIALNRQGAAGAVDNTIGLLASIRTRVDASLMRATKTAEKVQETALRAAAHASDAEANSGLASDGCLNVDTRAAAADANLHAQRCEAEMRELREIVEEIRLAAAADSATAESINVLELRRKEKSAMALVKSIESVCLHGACNAEQVSRGPINFDAGWDEEIRSIRARIDELKVAVRGGVDESVRD